MTCSVTNGIQEQNEDYVQRVCKTDWEGTYIGQDQSIVME